MYENLKYCRFCKEIKDLEDFVKCSECQKINDCKDCVKNTELYYLNRYHKLTCINNEYYDLKCAKRKFKKDCSERGWSSSEPPIYNKII